MRIKIRAVSALAAAGLALATAGCGQGTGDRLAADPGSGDQVTIKMMHLWPESGALGQHRIVNKIIEEYEAEHPNVVVKQEVLDNEQYKAKLRVLSAVNDLPDVGLTWAAGALQPFVEGGLFTPLDDLLQGELKDSFVAGTTEAYAVDGKTYALPLEFNIAPIYYNKELFREFHLEVPKTYDELRSIIGTLAAGGVAPIALGNQDRWTGSMWYMYMADRIAGAEALAEAIGGERSFADPRLVRAARSLQDLVGAGAFSPDFNGLSNDEAKAMFLSGKAAMYMVGAWELPNFTTNQDIPQRFRDNVGFFKFPTVEGGKGDIDGWVGGPGVGLFVAENSAVKAEAKSFVEYFVKRWGERSVTDAGVIPATKVDTAAVKLPQLYVDLLNEMNKATSITLFADVQLKPGAAETHLNQIQALFGKAVTPEAFAAAHDKVIKAGQ
ncbi:carbohydrate ABC transporter substrate-binding protein, CUT1 family (TC 3.A.1.1.-) [Cohnella sp. OV330]|nr:carbohydrate ABC transporter substrate-binding protein, CUT1 family (TC 3.A.1.1.-) [Cohnella sp. OV330]